MLSAVLSEKSGVMWAFVSAAALLGAYIAVKMIDVERQSHWQGQLLSGVSICVDADPLCIAVIHIMR